MAELGETADPRELVPGNAEAISDTLWLMRGYGDALHAAGEGLKRIDTTDGWSGKAADGFREVFHGQPSKWLVAGDGFHDAANALERYASTLTWSQQQAGVAIQQWEQGQAASRQAKASAVGQPPGSTAAADPGEATRAAARATLADARRQLDHEADAASSALARACENAPAKPGFWSHVGDFLSGLGHDAENVGADIVNGLASFGNAAAHHPGDLLALAGGAALTTISAAGDGLGLALDATGVGAVAGLPLNAISTAGVVAGGGLVVAAMADLGHHAASDDRVSPMAKDVPSDETAGPARGSDGDLKYEKSDKHGAVQRGNAAPAPTNGQQALEDSVSIKPTTSRRVSVDPTTGEYVVFDETYPGSGIYHGHVRPWSGPDGLDPAMQAALRRAGLVNGKGKILGK